MARQLNIFPIISLTTLSTSTKCLSEYRCKLWTLGDLRVVRHTAGQSKKCSVILPTSNFARFGWDLHELFELIAIRELFDHRTVVLFCANETENESNWKTKCLLFFLRDVNVIYVSHTRENVSSEKYQNYLSTAVRLQDGILRLRRDGLLGHANKMRKT